MYLPCEISPPSSVTTPASRGNSGLQPTSVLYVIRISPSQTLVVLSPAFMTQALPLTCPGYTRVPFTSSPSMCCTEIQIHTHWNSLKLFNFLYLIQISWYRTAFILSAAFCLYPKDIKRFILINNSRCSSQSIKVIRRWHWKLVENSETIRGNQSILWSKDQQRRNYFSTNNFI